ncbi:MAG: hypothetical protein R2773_01485 [Flavobacteriaceae bacterium]
MKHHYFNGVFSHNEGLKPRKVLVSDNPVLRILKKNGYQKQFDRRASLPAVELAEDGI